MQRRAIPTISTLLFVLAAAACSGNDGKISIDSAGSALTDNGGDALFIVKLTESGQDNGYSLDGLKVKVTPDGKDAIEVTCAVNDSNANQKLDKDETLLCKEGSGNDFGKGLAGKEVKIELFAKIDGDEERVGDGKWTPN